MLMAPRAERVSSPLAHFEQASARSAQNFFSRKDSWRLREAEQRGVVTLLSAAEAMRGFFYA